jgi:regulatory protein
MDEPPSTPVIQSIRSVGGRQRLLALSDGREFAFGIEACERVGVFEGQEATPGLLGALDEADRRARAHGLALRLLTHRARSQSEMRTRLSMRGVDPETIEWEVARLQEAGLLDDDRFARAWVEDRKRQSPRGRRLLRYELLGRGIGPEAIDAVVADVDDRETALALARRKGAHTAAESYEKFFARVGDFLRRRGFDYEVAAEAAKAAWREIEAERRASAESAVVD